MSVLVDVLIGLGLTCLILFVILFAGFILFQLLANVVFRVLLGVVLLCWIWASVTPSFEPFAWIASVFIGLVMISPWLFVIVVGGFVVGYFLARK